MQATQDRRISRRTRVLRNAKIILSDRDTLVHCTLLDLSRSGACLSVSSTYKLFETFELTFDNGRTRRKCRVRWRTATKLGVTFEHPGN
jgi:PilZ domain